MSEKILSDAKKALEEIDIVESHPEYQKILDAICTVASLAASRAFNRGDHGMEDWCNLYKE
jgi:hypothetical protein